MKIPPIVFRLLEIGAIAAGVVLGILAALTVLGAPVDSLVKLVVLAILAVPFVLIYRGMWAFPAAVVLQLVSVALIVIVNWPAIFAWVDGALNTVFAPGTRRMNVVDCYSDPGCSIIYPIVFAALVFFVVLTGFAYTTLLERRLLAFFQNRVGPNRVGPQGFLQPAADGVKLIFKEDIMPAGADRPVYLIAPLLKTVPVLVILAVLPLGPHILIPWFAPTLGDVWYEVPLALSDPNVGVLWLLAITSLGTYGVVLAGWASDNKYAMLGGLRAASQMVSYELSLGLTIAVPILLAGSLSVMDIVSQQKMIWEWYVFQNPLAAGILLVALLAEVNRAPFDLPEAEQELTAGFMTEYSGMKFAMFMMGEYLGMIAVSWIAVSMFFGGYQDGFGLVDSVPILGPLVVIGKIVLMLMAMIWIRATLPRIRYDRLMHFGWKVLLPLALVAVCWTAISVVIGEVFQSTAAYGVVSGIIFTLVIIGGYLFLRRDSEEDEDELDPMITGERSGVGYAALQVVGGILAGPFVLYNFTLKILDDLAAADPDSTPATTTAIEEVKPSDNKPSQTK
jgi:NADH-quinone oxidoreductase subunit H